MDKDRPTLIKYLSNCSMHIDPLSVIYGVPNSSLYLLDIHDLESILQAIFGSSNSRDNYTLRSSCPRYLSCNF